MSYYSHRQIPLVYHGVPDVAMAGDFAREILELEEDDGGVRSIAWLDSFATRAWKLLNMAETGRNYADEWDLEALRDLISDRDALQRLNALGDFFGKPTTTRVTYWEDGTARVERWHSGDEFRTELCGEGATVSEAVRDACRQGSKLSTPAMDEGGVDGDDAIAGEEGDDYDGPRFWHDDSRERFIRDLTPDLPRGDLRISLELSQGQYVWFVRHPRSGYKRLPVGNAVAPLSPYCRRQIIEAAGSLCADEGDTVGKTSKPARYTAQGRETIDRQRDLAWWYASLMAGQAWTTGAVAKYVFAYLCEAQAMRYEDRAGLKDNREEDLAKAQWYLEMKAHVMDGDPDPRAGRPDFKPYVRLAAYPRGAQ